MTALCDVVKYNIKLLKPCTTTLLSMDYREGLYRTIQKHQGIYT